MALKSYNLESLTILVLEKHVLLRNLLTKVFVQFGVPTVYSTPDADKAFEIFCEMEPDIILADWTKDLDGMGFLFQVRQSPQSPNPYVPVIICTANTELRHVCTARDAGMTEFLAKPVSARTIYSRICNVIEHNRPYIRVRDFFGPDRRRRKPERVAHERRKYVANS